MAARPELSIVLPVYNEEPILRQRLMKLCDELRTQGLVDFEVIAVENGSTDRTPELLCALQKEIPALEVFQLSSPSYGKALREAMVRSRGNYIVHFDLDYWDVVFIKMCLALVPFGYDVIVGSKNLFLSTDMRHALRRCISQSFRIILHILFRLKVSDTHGIKFCRNSAALQDIIRSCGYSNHMFDTELVIRAQYANMKLLELPVELKELRKSSISIIKRLPIALYELIMIWLRIHFRERREKGC